MRGIPLLFIMKGLVGTGFEVALPGGDAGAATAAQLPRFANAELYLAGHRLLYGTTSGACNDTLDVRKVTSHAAVATGSAWCLA